MHDQVEWLAQALAREAKYGHYLRIPGRICRCLDYFKVSSDRKAVHERLISYYLFIGVVDEEIDSNRLEAGWEVLEQFDRKTPALNDGRQRSRVRLVTEVLRRQVTPEMFPAVMGKLEDLYEAVVGERTAPTMPAYIEQRRAVGRLTADVSYLLVQPLLNKAQNRLRRFMRSVGEVGCLLDSVIDLRADERLGLLAFRPSRQDHLQLTGELFHTGIKVLVRHPRLAGLFLEAVGDNLLDWLRAGLSGWSGLDKRKALAPSPNRAGLLPFQWPRNGSAK